MLLSYIKKTRKGKILDKRSRKVGKNNFKKSKFRESIERFRGKQWSLLEQQIKS